MKTGLKISEMGSEVGELRFTLKNGEGKTLGWIEASKLRDNDIEIAYIFVEKKFRGLGVGRVLISIIEKHFKDKNLVALIDPSSDSSLTREQEEEWFKRMGFYERTYVFGTSSKKKVMYLDNNLKENKNGLNCKISKR